MIWYQQGEHHGVIKTLIESPDQPTVVMWELWSREKDGQPGECLDVYQDRDLALSRIDLLDRFRETAREAFLADPEWQASQSQEAAQKRDAAPVYDPAELVV